LDAHDLTDVVEDLEAVDEFASLLRVEKSGDHVL